MCESNYFKEVIMLVLHHAGSALLYLTVCTM